jgi:16S rRNA (uracil1498-N3)-methyltransferase
MHRFFSAPDNIHDSTVILDRDETRHLRDVLRLTSGETVNVFDGAGREFECKILNIRKNETELSIAREISPPASESSLDLTLAAAMLKGEKFDLVVQKAVELGVAKLTPLRTARCDVLSKDSAKRVDRWRKIALEASKQSGRATLMQIDEPVEFETVLTSFEQPENVLFFSERAGGKVPKDYSSKKITAIVGPEGGWDDSEIYKARSKGIPIITFGGRILRAETAAIAVTAILQHRLGDVN